MVLTIVGCGYVGTAVARKLQSRRQDHPLVLTTTREERRPDLTALADRVQICDATNPEQLKAALPDSSAAVFCLVRGTVRWMPMDTEPPSWTASTA